MEQTNIIKNQANKYMKFRVFFVHVLFQKLELKQQDMHSLLMGGKGEKNTIVIAQYIITVSSAC